MKDFLSYLLPTLRPCIMFAVTVKNSLSKYVHAILYCNRSSSLAVKALLADRVFLTYNIILEVMIIESETKLSTKYHLSNNTKGNSLT